MQHALLKWALVRLLDAYADDDHKTSHALGKRRCSIYHVCGIGRMEPVRRTFVLWPGSRDRPWQFAADTLPTLWDGAYFS